MRSTEEIKEDAFGHSRGSEEFILETLLDIRELLIKLNRNWTLE